MSHTRRTFLRHAALGSAAASLTARLRAQSAPNIAPQGLARPPARPNLLFLWTDQHRGDAVPWAGNSALKANEFFAPFGERSFIFHDAHITQPVCTPSRGSIMSGLWPHNHGAVNNNQRFRPGVRTLAEHLTSEYRTAYYGKWHLGDEHKAQRGFQDWRAIEDLYRQYYTDPADLAHFSHYHNHLLAHGFPPDDRGEDGKGAAVFSRTLTAALPERYTKVSFLADEAATYLRERRDGQPFVLHVNSLEPHPPSYGPLNDLHDPDAMTGGPAFAQPLPNEASRLARRQYQRTHTDGYKNHPIATSRDWRRLRANYYGLVSMVDRAFARVLRALEESGQADKTIVVYTSDHGDMCGDHCLMQKGNFYRGAVHVPLAIHVPWLSRQRVDFRGPVSTVDLVPTVLDLMGIGPAAPLDGVSRAPALRNPTEWRREDLCIEWNDAEDEALSGRSRVTADGWKLNLYHDDAPELFDLNSDPGERVNRAAAPSQRDRLRRLIDDVRAWQQAQRDTLILRN